MPEDRLGSTRSDKDTAPKVDSRMKSSVDGSYDPAQDGSVPLETVSVKGSESSAWPIAWAVITILMVLLAIYLLFG